MDVDTLVVLCSPLYVGVTGEQNFRVLQGQLFHLSSGGFVMSYIDFLLF